MSQVMDSVSASSVMPRALFTAEEVADALVISETLVRQLTLDGELPCRRIGRLVRYTIADIEMFIASREEHRYRK
jgi:excisionase family DNA binding protein